jgi:PAS domain S-box-containing protein
MTSQLPPGAPTESSPLASISALRESEERFRSADDYAAIGMAITSPDERWMRLNRAFCAVTGYTEDELIGDTFRRITHPDDLARDLERRQRMLDGELDRCRVEKRLLHKDGHWVWVELNVVVVRDALGAPLHFIAQFQDITERRRAEAALRESEARYERIAANVPGIVYQFIYLPDGGKRFTFVSEGARALCGVAPEAILRDPNALFGLIHPEDLPGMHASGQAAVAALRPWRWEGRLLLPTGEQRWVQAASHNARQPDGSVLADGLIMDITEQRQAAARLEESEQRYRSLFDHHPDAVFSTDTEGRYTSANPACETISGYSPEELIGQPYAPFIAPNQLAKGYEHLDSALAGRAKRSELAIAHKSGRHVELDVTSIPIIVGGKVVGVFGIARDLTAQRALEAQLRQSQKMEAVGQLAGGVAHDFNNILTAIAGFAEFLQDEFEPGDPRREDVGEILKGAHRAASLTAQLLAFSRKQVLRSEVLDLNQVMTEMTAMLRPLLGSSLHLVTLPAHRAVPVLADRTQLEQVIMNLAVNARDAMQGDGTLSIEICISPAEPGAPQRATLIVSDTGAGMSPEVVARIFEPFFTTKPAGRGSGLGLATVHGIVQQSGGTISVESRPGEGTSFTITLPLASGSRTRPITGEMQALRDPRGGESDRTAGTVLIAEDEEAVRAIAQRLLERAGYRVLTARHGADALRVLEQAGGTVDVLLSDVVMPEMGGVELAARATEMIPGLPVVLMSGYTDNDLGPINEEGMVAGFISKPFTSETLLETVKAAVRSGYIAS